MHRATQPDILHDTQRQPLGLVQDLTGRPGAGGNTLGGTFPANWSCGVSFSIAYEMDILIAVGGIPSNFTFSENPFFMSFDLNDCREIIRWELPWLKGTGQTTFLLPSGINTSCSYDRRRLTQLSHWSM
jgi:hypothetical protein